MTTGPMYLVLARLMNSLGLALFMLLLLASEIGAQTTSSGAIFDKVLQPLRQRTRVPLRLPSYLATESETSPLYAIIMTATSKRYELQLAFTPDCDGENVCRYGMVSGIVAPPRPKRPPGKPVKLMRGITGYFIDAKCDRTCSDSTLTWQQDGHRYVVGIKAADIDTLRKVANSAIDKAAATP